MILLIGLLAGIGLSQAQAQYPTPFSCTDGVSYIITGNPSALSTVNLRTGALTPLFSASTLGNRNLTGLGYNPKNNFLYASISGTSDILRIGGNGVTQQLTVPGLPADTYEAGDVAPDGTFYLYSASTTTMYKVNLSTLAVSTIALSSVANVQDISITPDGLNILGISAGNGNLIRWSTSGGALTQTLVGTAGAMRAATFMDKTGDLFLIDEANSRTYEVSGPTFANSTSETQLSPTNATALTNTDGARCVTSLATTQPVFACQPNTAFNSTVTKGYSNTINDCASSDGKSTLLEYNLSTGAITNTSTQLITDFNTRTSINNLGYNPTDNFLWAYRTHTNQLVRIGLDRSVDYFAIPGLVASCGTGTTPDNTNFFSGDINSAGVMYLLNGVDGDRIVRVDLNSASPTYLTRLSDVVLSLSPGARTLSYIQDLAFNPIDNQLYTVSVSNILYRINPSTGVVTALGTVTGLPAPGQGFVVDYFDITGTLYIKGGAAPIYKIPNVAGGGLTASLFSNGPVTTGGDGARCAYTIVSPTFYTLSGNVLNDGNGLSDGTVNTSGTGAQNPVNGTDIDPTTSGSQPVYATLVNSDGTVIATVPVTSSGTYSFTAVPSGTYSVVLSTNPAGSTTASLPANWNNTGENLGSGTGSDGTPNGILTNISVASTNVTNANFGINNKPVVVASTDTPRTNPGGTATTPVSSTVFSGSDPEDGTYPTNLTGREVTLNPATNGTLYYNGTPVTSPTSIPNFDPSKVTLDPAAPGATTGSGGAYPDPTFTYSVKDNAGVSSDPKTVTVPFTTGATTVSISGNVLNDGNGLSDGTVNTSGTGAQNPVNGTDIDPTTSGSQPVYATLVNSSGTAVATVPVTTGGSYSFTGVTPGTYSVVLSTNPAGSTTASLPANWNNTGENLGSGAGSDGTPNGILTNISVASTNVTNANFGINNKPVVVASTDTPRTNPGGTATTPVSSTVFSGSDPEDGTYPTNLTGREVTLNPATNGTLYYNGTPVTSPTSIPNFDPSKVTLDPAAPGATTGSGGAYPDPTFTYSVKDNAGVSSDPKTVTVPFTAPVPDLTPIIYVRPSTVYNTTNMTAVVDVLELLGVPTSGQITVRVTKDSKFVLTFPPTATSIGGRGVQNSSWTFDGTSNPNYYILTTNQVVAAGDKLSFGFTGVLTPGATTGTLTTSVVIIGGSGGEVRANNNTDADKVDYFQQ